ncbi:uncharacterized protein N7496_002667 [Penicillium cataractarum]|uniref:Uncharacterized protein n=1 Tax=Penicillium cataractarum TaxID=2100454 RepID=A0A9W9SMZ2_9EURO|nr:uncharacterized protein N7496_002667 [Penicillium cataractarum]KAJ5380239.1 hypothetical protein N7496_002667 [Penicillium cataractarum]
MLKENTPQTQWTHFANVTARNVAHKASFWQSGSVRALRLEQTTTNVKSASPSLEKRVTTDDVYLMTGFAKENNLIASIYWVEDDQTSWDDWVADVYGDYIMNMNSELSCLDVNDAGGPVFQSAWVVSDNDLIYEVEQDDIVNVLSSCYNMDPVS